MKYSAKLSSMLFVVLALFLGCSQTTDSDTVKEDTLIDMSKKEIQKALLDLDIDTEGYSSEYDTFFAVDPGAFGYEKSFISNDNSRYISSFVRFANYYDYTLGNNNVGDIKYTNLVDWQSVVEATNEPINLSHITFKYDGKAFDTTDFDSYEQTYASWEKEMEGSFGDPISDWKIEENKTRNILLKKTDTHLVVIYLPEVANNVINFGSNDVYIFKTKAGNPFDYMPSTKEINTAIQEKLDDEQIDITGFSDAYSWVLVVGKDYSCITEGKTQFFSNDGKTIALDWLYSTGEWEYLNNDGGISFYDSATDSLQITDVLSFISTEEQGDLIYNGKMLNLNGYTWYSRMRDGDSSKTHYLEKFEDEKYFFIEITVDEATTEITQIDGFLVYEKQ